jgi:hypothetical protein
MSEISSRAYNHDAQERLLSRRAVMPQNRCYQTTYRRWTSGARTAHDGSTAEHAMLPHMTPSTRFSLLVRNAGWISEGRPSRRRVPKIMAAPFPGILAGRDRL